MMGRMKDYESYDALGLAQLLRKGETSAEELLDAALSRVESRNPHLNAVNITRARRSEPACPKGRSAACRSC